jgi:O-antigen/teichoic acid export membrane protein
MLYCNIAYIAVLISSKSTGIRQMFELLWRLKGRTYLLTALLVIDTLVALIAVAIVAYMGKLTVLWLTVIFAVSNLPGFLAIVLPLIRNLRASGVFSRPIPRRYYRMLITAALPIAFMVIMGQTSAQLETLMIDSTARMSKADIAAYNAAIKPLTGLIFIATAIGFGLAPIVSQHSKGVRDDYSFEFIASVGLRIIGVISLAICLMCGLFGQEIMKLFGPQYTGEVYILQIYSVISALTFMVVMHDQFLLAIGKRAQTLQGAMLYLTLALITEPIMIRLFGIRGMMYAKGLAICCLILFQLSRFAPGVRLASAKAFGRLLPSGGVLLGSLMLTDGLTMPLRVLTVSAAFAGSVLGMKTVKISELKALRAMRVA